MAYVRRWLWRHSVVKKIRRFGFRVRLPARAEQRQTPPPRGAVRVSSDDGSEEGLPHAPVVKLANTLDSKSSALYVFILHDMFIQNE